MCGIVGQLTAPSRVADRDLIERMCQALEHRGPDSRGVHADGRVAMGIQRLRVIDLATGDQPIYNEDRTVVVVMNGEIYNYRELHEDLRRRGHTFATAGDTEVIVHLYEEHGRDCVRHLDGMFAFSLWDARRRTLLLARDRIGKKPLLYAERSGGLTWASEMGALLADRAVERTVDPQALDAYLALGYVPTPASILTGIRKLPPAHTLVVDEHGAHLEQYWSLDFSQKLDEPVDSMCERIRDGLLDATRKRLIADVPVGAFLSGGIDSSAVVAAMARTATGPIRTFAIGFDHQELDELPYARIVAHRYGTIHEEFRVQADATRVLPRIVRHYGEPFADSSAIPTFYLADLTRQHVTVALNGDGGDECFAGYQRYVANAVAARLDVLPAAVRRGIAAAAGRLDDTGGVSSRRNRVRRLAAGLPLESPDRYLGYVSWFQASQRATLYAPGFAAELDTGSVGRGFAQRWEQGSGDTVLDRMLEVDSTTYLVGDLLAKVDIATMAHALEARSPFLDPALMQLAASLPAHYKVRGQEKKWILRRALREWLPPEVLDRPKQGFSVPLTQWLGAGLGERARDVLLDPSTLARGYFEPAAVRRLLDRHAQGAEGEAKRVYALLMLELWHREFAAAGAVPASLAA